MATTNDLLVDYQYPLKVVNKNANKDIDLRSKDRIWYSQPRPDTDATWEILRITLRAPILINYISFGILNRSCYYEIWVTSEGRKSKLLDSDLNFVQGFIQGGLSTVASSWREINVDTNPIIISQIEIKQRRTGSGTGQLVSLGVRDFIMKRTIRTQEDTLYSLSQEVDILGNPVRRVVKDWRPQLAVDNDSFTFWKSSPQPSPDAVVNFYATIGDGINPKRVDRIWIDPVYTGNNLNVYYSTDPTIGTISPKPNKATTAFINSQILIGSGVILNASGQSYSINTTNLMSQNGVILKGIGQYGWIGGEIELGTEVTGSTVIFHNPAATNQSLEFNATTKVFTFTNNIAGHTNSKVVSNTVPCSTGDRIQFIIETSSDSVTGYVKLRLIVSVSGVKISDTSFTDINNDNLSILYTPGASLIFDSKIGYLRNLIVKVKPDTENQYNSFMIDAASFVRPNIDVSVQPKSFVIQSNLDNAILVGAYTTGQDAYGGLGEEFYAEKMWTPIWKNWTVQRGFYYLPEPVAACHLKLEFSKLTEQPYPIYETGIVVPYKVFPSYIVNSSASNGSETVAPTNSISVPVSVDRNAERARKYAPMSTIVTGSKIVDNIRNRTSYDFRTLINEQIRTSSLKATNYNSNMDIVASVINKQFSSSNGYSVLDGSSDEDQSLSINNSLISPSSAYTTPSTTLGTRTPAWWYLPGGLQLSADQMKSITETSTQTERFSNSSETSTMRTRFTTMSVHKYENRTAKRDVGLAYFAGIRGFEVFTIDKTVPTDSDQYTVIDYASDITSSSNMRLHTVGGGLGSYPIDPAINLTDGQIATATFRTWNSIGTFVKVGVKTVDRGLHSDAKGFPVEPMGLDNTGGFWDDSQTTWSDSVNVWGSNSALVGLDFQSNLYFSGREAVKVFRSKGVGAAGVRTKIIDLVQGDRVRLCVSVYRPKTTNNTFTLQLVDETPITGSVLYEQDVEVLPGSWQTIKTDFFVNTAERNLLRVYFLIDGEEEETLYLSDLYDEETSIVYSISNDAGTTWYEATEILNEPNQYLILPTPGNRLRVKVDMYDHRDFAYGLTVQPHYLF